MKIKKNKICVIGLGYVGLPLAIKLSKFYDLVGYDHDKKRILELKNKVDITNEIKTSEIKRSGILFTHDKYDIKDCNIYIITVPTPVDSKKKPLLTSLINVTKTISLFLKDKDLIIYESTIYPGCTDEILIPTLESLSKKKVNKNFYVGYSPERINPGITKHKLTNQSKVISGSNKKVASVIKKIYGKIIKKKLFIADSIKVAEAAKMIENTQRDINIAFINEISVLFHKLNINTTDVLNAAATKWNFLNFKPGLVGGHCVGVDPYYLKFKAQNVGLNPHMISSGRKVNDSIPKFIVKEIFKLLKLKKKKLKNNKILLLGITFKENCNDFRNSQAITLFKLLKKNQKIDVYDNLANKKDLFNLHKINLTNKIKKKNFYDIIIVCVPHEKIKRFKINFLKSIGNKKLIIIDIKSIYPKKSVEWQL